MMQEEEILKPPPFEIGVLGWIKKHLFSTWYNIILSLVSITFIIIVFRRVFIWIFFKAEWKVIPTNIKVFLIGRYPIEEAWRIILCLFIILVLAVISWSFRKTLDGRIRKWITAAWILSLPVIGIFLRGFSEESNFLPQVSPEIWSGLLLTLVLAVVGILASFPIGVMFALGRRSKLPIIRILSTIYIEMIRGVPLISILFMSQLMIPLFLPPSLRIGTVIRALIGMTLFSSAYTAENIRGGLAAVPRGQYEAARALGLNPLLTTFFIILPQALRAVIPVMVGQFISLFKDTTLVVIVGLLDLLGIAKAVTGQREFLGLHMEVYFFAAIVFFVFCSTMSYVSKRIEISLGVGSR